MSQENEKKNNDSQKNSNNEKGSDKVTDKFSETLKKIVTAGSAAEVSKEILGSVVGQVVKTKDDITLKATQEMIALIRKIDFVKEFSKFAENHKFKISAEIEILKKEDKEK